MKIVEMDQPTLERRLLRCRYLIHRAARHRLGLTDKPRTDGGHDAFIREWHRAQKKAEQLLIDTTIELESDLKRVTETDKDSNDAYRYRYWLTLVASCCETFVFLAFRPCDIQHLYKGPRHGSLAEQNVQSVLKIVNEINQSPYAIAFPLDFTRFSCTGDLLHVERRPDGQHVAVVEVKEGEVNEAFHQARAARTPEAWFEFFDKFGDKGIQQAQRVFKQDKEFFKRQARMQAEKGIHKDEDGTRVVIESEVPLEHFVPVVESVCSKARKGEYAVEVVDGCLMIAAVDATSKERAMIGEFDARLFALNAFIAPGIGTESPQRIATELAKVNLIHWLDGLHAIALAPLFVRPLRPRTFLNLAFGRIRLLCFFHPPAFIDLLQSAGIRAELFTRKHTNRLRSVQGWRGNDLPPLHEGRAIAYYVGEVPFVVGSMRLHEMVFNWARPASLAVHMADGISRAPEVIIPGSPVSHKSKTATDTDRG